MTGFGQPRWEVLDPSISWQNRKSQGMVRLQSGTNRLTIIVRLILKKIKICFTSWNDWFRHYS